MEGETKTARIEQLLKINFSFISLFFFLKIQDIRKPKTPSFERGYHKNVLGQAIPYPNTESSSWERPDKVDTTDDGSKKVYSGPKAYSEYCQTSVTKHFIQILS